MPNMTDFQRGILDYGHDMSNVITFSDADMNEQDEYGTQVAVRQVVPEMNFSQFVRRVHQANQLIDGICGRIIQAVWSSKSSLECLSYPVPWIKTLLIDARDDDEVKITHVEQGDKRTELRYVGIYVGKNSSLKRMIGQILPLFGELYAYYVLFCHDGQIFDSNVIKFMRSVRQSGTSEKHGEIVCELLDGFVRYSCWAVARIVQYYPFLVKTNPWLFNEEYGRMVEDEKKYVQNRVWPNSRKQKQMFLAMLRDNGLDVSWDYLTGLLSHMVRMTRDILMTIQYCNLCSFLVEKTGHEPRRYMIFDKGVKNIATSLLDKDGRLRYSDDICKNMFENEADRIYELDGVECGRIFPVRYGNVNDDKSNGISENNILTNLWNETFLCAGIVD